MGFLGGDNNFGGDIVVECPPEKMEEKQHHPSFNRSISSSHRPGGIMEKLKSNVNFFCLYLAAAGAVYVTMKSFHDIGLSTLLTFSVFIQCVALGSLCLSIINKKSVAGVSFKCIWMQGLSFALRLSSTSWLKGYIPVDSTGDWLYQLVDGIALSLCVIIGGLAMFKYNSTYESDQDTFPAKPLVLACAALSVVIHPDLNNRPVFDAIWTCSLYVDVFSMLPQIFMMMRERVDAISAHYVALIGLSRCIDMIFWSYGYEELAPEKGGFNLAGWTVLISHVLHLLLMADFLFLYIRSIIRSGFSSNSMELGSVGDLIDVV